MTRYVLPVTIFALVVVSGGSCTSSRKMEVLLRDSGERWVLIGDYSTPREKEGPPKENWVGIFEIPGESLVRLVGIPMRTPDGESELFPRVTFNEPRKTLICERDDIRDDVYNDVWRYDLATGQTRWIAKGKWNKTRGFAWSPDGSKVAFVASTRGEPAAFVMQYDLDADRLDRVADDAFGNRDDQQEGDSSVRPRRPVYSEDGRSLYFVSMDRHVKVVELSTGEITKLPFADAIVVLTVKDEHLVYARQVGVRKDWRFEIVKAQLNASIGSGGEQVLHATHGVIWGNYVSPSRRFVLVTSRAGYGSETRLIDVDQGVTLPAGRLVAKDGFRPHGTVFVGASP